MDTVFAAGNTYFGPENMTLRDLIKALRDTYCCNIGAEFMYLSDPAQKRWIQQRLESIRSTPLFTAEEKLHILDRLTAAEGLERYLHTKYVGQKRFSLEGGESFIAAMDELVQRAGAKGVQEIVIGMAHRGRLNVLVNTLGKMPKDLFAEFEGKRRRDLPAGRRQVPQRLLQRRHRRPAGPCTCRSRSTRRTSKSSIRWSRARCARARTGAATRTATRCCRCWCTATPPSPARAS